MKTIRNLAFISTFLALFVVVLGAYVRLSDAGLGCPDWPGCYGHVGVPNEAHEIERANSAYPERPVEIPKAWKEMVHRYFAAGLGFLILVMMVQAIRLKLRREENVPLMHTIALFLIVCFQGALGMWTVTLLVKPAIVTAHLFGGLTTMTLLWLLFIRMSKAIKRDGTEAGKSLKAPLYVALLLLIGQIFLGGWVSTNYAALSCPDFPTCQGQWWPNPDFHDAFTIWRGLGQDYEGGVLSNQSRVATHISHRIGAIVVAVWFALVIAMIFAKPVAQSTHRMGVLLLITLIAQIGLGISNIIFSLPLWVATAHNGGAAVLLLVTITLIYKSSGKLDRSRST